MKKKTKIILACIAACIIVAAVAVVIKVNLDKQAKKGNCFRAYRPS